MVLLSMVLLLLGPVWTCAEEASAGADRQDPLRTRLKEYGLVTPFSTDAHGHFLSHLLSATHKRRVRREVFPFVESDQNIFFNISAFGKEFHLRLRPNTRLVAPGAVVEWHDEVQGFGNFSGNSSSAGANVTDGMEELLRRELLKTDCTFIGDITDVPGASVAINNCDGLAFSLSHMFVLGGQSLQAPLSRKCISIG